MPTWAENRAKQTPGQVLGGFLLLVLISLFLCIIWFPLGFLMGSISVIGIIWRLCLGFGPTRELRVCAHCHQPEGSQHTPSCPVTVAWRNVPTVSNETLGVVRQGVGAQGALTMEQGSRFHQRPLTTCSFCGVQTVGAGATACARCGKPFAVASEVIPGVPKKALSFALLIAVAGVLLVGLLVKSFSGDGSGGSSETSNTTGSHTVTTSVPTLSGKPVVAYHLKRPGWPAKAACGTTSMNVIVERPVSDQGLVDLALDLHARYPNTYFEILNDQSRLKDFDQLADFPNAERRLGASGLKALVASMKPWQKKHYLATIALIAENGRFKWMLLGSDAHPTKADAEICDLDAKIVSMPECIAAAKPPR